MHFIALSRCYSLMRQDKHEIRHDVLIYKFEVTKIKLIMTS